MLFVTAFLSGLVFGVGLIISGMANPAKVLNFLDLAGAWDTSLVFVMGGAIAVGLVSFTFARRRTISILGAPLKLPTGSQLDRRLILGSALFGIGWGIAGFCPGPALVSLGMGAPKAALFVVSMLLGMGIFELLERRKKREASAKH